MAEGTGTADRPTIVLVHGAFASPAGWSRVADALRQDGYQRATPALGRCLWRTTSDRAIDAKRVAIVATRGS